MKKLLVISQILLVVLLLSSGVLAETLIFSTSFENDTVGQSPAGWAKEHDSAAVVIDGAIVSIPDGKKAVQLNNTPDAYGRISHEIPEVKNGKLVVNFYQPNAQRENINIEVHNADGRIVGIFITASGNLRVREAGVQSSNIAALANDKWHTLVITWDDTMFNVYSLENGREVVIKESCLVDPAVGNKPANRVSFDVSKRDDAKVAYIDNVRVYDLAK